MSQKFAKEFREVAEKYISGPHAPMLCQMMSQNAFVQQSYEKEKLEGGHVIGAFFKLMERTIAMARRIQEEHEDDEPDEEASSLA